MTKIIMLLLSSMALVLATNQEHNQTGASLIEKYDHNGDGKIFYTEASKELQDNFCQYDVNQDGFLDKEEVMAIK